MHIEIVNIFRQKRVTRNVYVDTRTFLYIKIHKYIYIYIIQYMYIVYNTYPFFICMCRHHIIIYYYYYTVPAYARYIIIYFVGKRAQCGMNVYHYNE